MKLSPDVIALSGGIGGAKLALGLQNVVAPGALCVLVNTGDDFRHFGLAISPDLDTVLYTLCGRAEPERGWGLKDESWTVMSELEHFSAPTWFRIGDRDLALHLERTRSLASGESLVQFTERMARKLGVLTRIIPMCNEEVRTVIESSQGALSFQEYFVARQCEPQVQSIRFVGAAEASVPTEAVELFENASLKAIVICPSNPYLSVDPILNVSGYRELLANAKCPVIAVCPVISGSAVKGPTAKIMCELGIEVTAPAIAKHYEGLIDGLVIDEQDQTAAHNCGVAVHVTQTLMRTLEDRVALARSVVLFADQLR